MTDSPANPRITTVFFDIGGVFASSFGKGFVDYASQTLGINETKLREIIDVTEASLQRGEINAHPNKQHIEFWYNVIEEAKRRGIPMKESIPDRRGLAQLWVKPYLDNVHIDENMIAFIRNLKETGNVRLYTLSNIQEPHVLILKKWLGDDFETLFDGHILSNEVHARKPDPEIYQIALDRSGCKSPDEAVFIDDSEKNLLGAKEVGMRTILHKEGDINSTQESLRELGVSWDESGTEYRTESRLPIS